MANRYLSIPYNERKSEALIHELEMQNKDISDELTPALDSLYERFVPPDVKEKVDAMIENDNEEEAKRHAVRFTSCGEEYCFIPEAPVNFHTAVQIYCEGIRDDAEHCTLDSLAEYFNDRLDIDDFTFSVICGAMPHDKRIGAVYDFNFDDGTLTVIDNFGERTRVYDLDDVYDAYTDAVEKSGGRCSGWMKYFNGYIAGKEIEITDETEAPAMHM